jgi:hypothetical protein
MSYSISTLLTRNLQDVLGKNDPARRRAAITEIFTEDSGVGLSGGVGGVPGATITTGAFNFQNYAQSGMQFNATLNFTGGGPTGTRGTDRVLGGWVQNATALDEGAIYQNGHAIPAVLATNIGDATSSFAGRPMFVPGDPAPQQVNPPVLDSFGRTAGFPAPGTGGYSSGLGMSQITSVSAQAQIGIQMLVEGGDSPGFSAPAVTPADGVSGLTQIHLNESFIGFLVVWTNVGGNNALDPVNIGPPLAPNGSPAGYGTLGSWADSVYGVVLEQPWSISATFAPNAAGNLSPVGNPTITANPATLQNPVVPPANATTLVVLTPPTFLSLWGKDARN